MLKKQKNNFALNFLLIALALIGPSNVFGQSIESLMTEYVTTSFDHFGQRIDGQAGSAVALAANNEAIAVSIAGVYDDEIGSGFTTIWGERLSFFDDYLAIFEIGSEAQVLSAKESIDDSVIRVAAYLEEVVTDFSGADARSQLRSVNNLFYAAMDAYASGDTTEYGILEQESTRQVSVLSKSLSDKAAADLILITQREEEALALAQAELEAQIAETERLEAEAAAAAQAAAEAAAAAEAEESAAAQAEADRLAEIAAAAQAELEEQIAEEAEAAAAVEEAAAAVKETFNAQAAADSRSASTDAPSTNVKTTDSEIQERVEATDEAVEETEQNTTISELSTENFVFSDTEALEKFAFVDVNETHDYVSILDIKDRGIVQGYEDGTYLPDSPINRAEFTKIVVGAVVSGVSGFDCFSDVGQEWFAGYVCTAKEQNIVGGYPDGTFKPGNEVNLAEAYKIVGETLFPGEALTTDVWYQGYVDLATSKGYWLGDGISISTSVTRGQMATIISKALAAREG